MKLFQTIALMAMAFALAASPVKAADPAPKVDGDVTEAWVNGMQVLVKRVPGAELFAANLTIRGGSRNWGKEDAGLEALALQVAANGGTKDLGKIPYARKLASMGSSIDASTGRDWSTLASKGLTRNFDSTFGLLADVFLQPAMPDAEVDLAKSQALIMLKREAEQPEGRLGILVNDTLYAGQPYANRPQGRVETMAGFSAAQLQSHLARLREGSRLLLVVVGDIDAAHVTAQAREAFGKLPKGSYVDTAYPRPSFSAPRLITEKRDLPTNYLQGWFTVPSPGELGYAAARVAMNYMWDQLFKEVRTKRNLSYAPGAMVVANQAGALGMVSVSAVDPTATYKVMLDELRRLQATPLSAAELAGSKSLYRTSFLANSESTDGQAALLAQWQLQAGDWRRSRSFLDDIRAVTAADVQAFARHDFAHLQTFMLGDPGKLEPALGNGL